jgi:arsenate reductase (thioredoxin)
MSAKLRIWSNIGKIRRRLRPGAFQRHFDGWRARLRLRRRRQIIGGMLLMDTKLKVLFLCTGNSCRSQMAEGWTRYLKGEIIEPYSAGVEVHGLNQRAVKVMAEVGIDISKQTSKHVREVMNVNFDYVITVCDNANESCPVFPGKTKRLHVGFGDPPNLTKAMKSEADVLNVYRRVRDDIKKFIESMPDILSSRKAAESVK